MEKKYSKGKKTHPMKRIMMMALASTLCAASAVYANPSAVSEMVRQQLEEVNIIDQQGWLETASVTWEEVQGASGYRVYYGEAGSLEADYKLLDDSLIRRYPGFFRADVLGLTEGDYVLKVVPVDENGEMAEQAALSQTVSVTAHTREGFAFAKQSPMGTGSGGYNDDGSVPEDAQIIYITADTVNEVQLSVITNSKGTETACTGLVDILAKRQKGYDKRPLIIRMIGTVKASDINGLNSNGYVQLKGIYNTTFEGVGEDATANGWGFLIRDAHNVELRNVGVMLFPDDAISLDTDNENIWVHNNDIFYGTAGSDKDQAKGDGSCDVKGFSNYVTVSYNHFWDSGKSSLCGMSDSKEFFVTYHHNWYDHSDSRHPRIRVGTIHIYNNYFDGNAKYGVGVTKGASAFVEANDFRNCKYPMLISRQGSDVATDSTGTFSGEPGGIIKAYNNQITGATRLVYQTEDEKEFDAYLAEARGEQVPDTYQSVEGSNTYNNFDTNSQMYSYEPDAPEQVRSKVTAYAGRINGGDLKWSFTETDDADYSVNTGLMAAIRAYESELVAVGGNVEASTPETPEAPENPEKPDEDGDNGQIITGSQIHNFTEQGVDSDVFSIAGNLSDSKGTVSYKGMTLTQCLKLESSTVINFSTDKPATLTLVFNEDFNKKVVVCGNKYTVSDGILTVELQEGDHTITKGDTANLFYMQLDIKGEADKGDDEVKELGVTLTAPDKVKSGETFEVMVGVENSNSDIYSQDFTVAYDKTQMTFVKAEAVEPSIIVAEDEITEGLRMIAATEGGKVASEGLIKLTFKAGSTTEEIQTAIGIKEVQLGIVNEGVSEAVTVEGVQKLITVEAEEQTNPVDKTVLYEVIAEAEELSSKAEIGTEPGNYPQAAKDALDEAIRAAEAVAEVSSDQEAVDNAVIALQEAMDEFKESKIQQTVPSKDIEDINSDGKVDVADLAFAAYYYRATSGDENWESAKAADINQDGQVNIVDLTAIAKKILAK